MLSTATGLLSRPKEPMFEMMELDRVQISTEVHFSNTPTGPEGPGQDGDEDLGLVTKTRIKTKKPSLYRVVIMNDDYTPMEFVVFILERIFNKNHEDAYRIMLHVHNHGLGVCGIYTYEVAETKVAQVRDLARRNEHPLRCDLERED